MHDSDSNSEIGVDQDIFAGIGVVNGIRLFATLWNCDFWWESCGLYQNALSCLQGCASARSTRLIRFGLGDGYLIFRYAFPPMLDQRGRPRNKIKVSLKSRHQELSNKSYSIKIGQTVQKLDLILCLIVFSL